MLTYSNALFFLVDDIASGSLFFIAGIVLIIKGAVNYLRAF